MSTCVRTIYTAPRHFRADYVPGSSPWEPFARAAEAYVAAHPDAVIVASTDWEPLEEPVTRATRWRHDGARVVVEGVRVDVTFAPWAEEDSAKVREHHAARYAAR